MIASKIGKTFLKAYNQKYDKEYSAKEFFEEVYWEMVFNHPLYLMSGGNSPLENPKISWKKGDRPSVENRKERLGKMISKIESDLEDASIIIGFPASDIKEFARTSGSVTDMKIKSSYRDKYLSWIGSALGIGVDNGFTILFDNPDILLATFEGWKVYRQFLNDESIEKLAGSKLNSWNGQWLNFYYKEDNIEDIDFSILSNEGFFTEGKGNDKGFIVIETIKWSRLFFNLSRKLSNETLTGYVYSLGQTNKTIGFIPFKFSDAKSLSDTYKKLFGEFDAMEHLNAFEKLLGSNIKEACKLGSIGVQALQPENLFKDILKNKQLNLIKYRTYKTWIIVMINKEETLQLTTEIAKLLHLFLKGSKGTERKNLIDNLFQSGKRNFLFHWEEIIKHSSPEDKKIQKEMSDKIFYMNKEEFGYFIVLLKLDFRYQEN